MPIINSFQNQIVVTLCKCNVVTDNPPYCLRYRYREILSEGIHAGSYVLTVLATDIDEEHNANLRFYLTGEGADHFALDKAAGTNFHKTDSESVNMQETHRQMRTGFTALKSLCHSRFTVSRKNKVHKERFTRSYIVLCFIF